MPFGPSFPDRLELPDFPCVCFADVQDMPGYTKYVITGWRGTPPTFVSIPHERDNDETREMMYQWEEMTRPPKPSALKLA